VVPRKAPVAPEEIHDSEARSHLSRNCEACHAGAARETCLHPDAVPDGSQPDGLAVVDVDPSSKTYSQIVHQVIMPNKGDEFHHFGWNACSSALSPLSGHAFLERRYLIIPGIRSSRIYVIDVKEPLKAKIHKIIEPGRGFCQDRLFPPAHHPLRPRRHLCLDAWRRR
jgi:hypothetical protein